MYSEGSSQQATVPKSKQERIRENQRRSRARRQEYLAELERRLKECSITCRQAEIERSAFADLQAENARLRALLGFAGVSGDIVETFGRESVAQQPIPATSVAFRQLKPKHTLQRVAAGSADFVRPIEDSCPPLPDPSSSVWMAPMPFENHPHMSDHNSYNVINPPTAPCDTQCLRTNTSSSASYDWNPNSDEKLPTSSNDGSFCGGAYSLLTEEDVQRPELGNVLGPLSKAMLEQYDPNPGEMAEISARLATIHGRPTLSEQHFQNSHALLQILNDMNASQMNQ